MGLGGDDDDSGEGSDRGEQFLHARACPGIVAVAVAQRRISSTTGSCKRARAPTSLRVAMAMAQRRREQENAR
jgi:hypothetical protein